MNIRKNNIYMNFKEQKYEIMMNFESGFYTFLILFLLCHYDRIYNKLQIFIKAS